MHDSLEQLIGHMRWADARTLEALRQTPQEDALRLLAHVLATEQIYHERIRGHDPWPQDFWPALSIAQCASLLVDNHRRYRRFLRDHTGAALEQEVRYRNSSGTVYDTPIGEMILHVALHGEHHRGQIARTIRAAGGEPAVTDFITYVRERKKT